MAIHDEYTKGRGAQSNPKNRFATSETTYEDAYLNHAFLENENLNTKTTYLDVYPKTILNKVSSPDVPMGWSMNPYQGCEHGCVYCFARNTHEYWGYSAGEDFESKILVKRNAAQLLRQKFKSKSWKGETVMMSGNTDCYQPIEQKMGITRALLKVCLEHRNPVGIITKNALVLRDLDLLKELAQSKLSYVNISLTTLSEETRRKLEPRTSSVKSKLDTIEKLSREGIPVKVLLAPIIPSVNDHEIFEMIKNVAERGAVDVSYIFVRLNGQIGDIFTKWAYKAYPDRAEKILSQIKESRSGKLNESRFGERMRGNGQFADHINNVFKLAKGKHFSNPQKIDLRTDLFRNDIDGQLQLFG